jgi:hypothetical protein
MKKVLLHLLVFCLALASGCRDRDENAYVRLTGNIFIFNYRIAEVNFVVTLAKTKPTPEGAKVIGRFDNPAGGERIVIEKKIFVNNDKIVLESAALRCVVKDRPYLFEIEVRGADSAVLQKLSGKLVSSLDQNRLPDRPLVVGPVYTPNPELALHADGAQPGSAKVPCP